VCDMLDRHPETRRSFPEVLSLRDLDHLLAEVVHRDILERSKAAVAETRDLVPVFVPTQSYYKACVSLQRHAFVVLDGPPEMGKTAIARVIALAHLVDNWQAIECRDPNDFFDMYSETDSQIFVADDAFGRTEYDPVLGRCWERDLSRVFHFLDRRHRLIWTTRKHILMRALHEIDLTGKAASFPEPGEVIVTASDLTMEEKARMLYRHARAARLDSLRREVVKTSAKSIIKDAHFTPERIRRLVQEVLPRASSVILENADLLGSCLQEAIRNPTDRMRKSFRALTDARKWLLISLLDCDASAKVSALRERFFVHRPGSAETAFSEGMDELLGTFLRRSPYRLEGEGIEWIHPSYRDLVIDELASDPSRVLIFLQRVSIAGVKLALSQAGGAGGERAFPLMMNAESWETLGHGCKEIVDGAEDSAVGDLIDVLGDASKIGSLRGAPRAYLETLLRRVLSVACRKWDEQATAVQGSVIAAFVRAARRLTSFPNLPAIEISWRAAVELVDREVDKGTLSDSGFVRQWSELRDVIERCYLSVADSEGYVASCTRLEGRLFELAQARLKDGIEEEDPATNRMKGRVLEEFADALAELDRGKAHEGLISGLLGIAEEYQEIGKEHDEGDMDDYQRGSGLLFDVDILFEDL